MPKGIWGRVGISGLWRRLRPNLRADPGCRGRALSLRRRRRKLDARERGDHNLRQRAWYYMHIFADPKNVDTVYVLNVSMYRSTDGGKSFDVIHAPHGDNHGLWIDPDNPQRMILGNDGGAAVSVDSGKTWSTQDQPADRAVLPRDRRQSLSLLRLRRAAGQHHGGHRQPQR